MLRTQPTGIEPLVIFRILFGGLMAFGAVRFMASGWIERLYGEPEVFFSYPGFEWVPVPHVAGMYVLYAVIAMSATMMALGLFYRFSTVVFFLSFTWSELTDLTNYLNHYYLVILLSFLMIWLPAHRAFSLDVRRKHELATTHIPRWCTDILKIQIGLVYFFAGLAKLNADWLINAMPLAIWLPERSAIPVLGAFFTTDWAPYLMSWAGAAYDLSIPFLLLYRRTRVVAYIAVLGFHFMTHLLFNIGLFPLIMVTTTLIFFSPEWHRKLLLKIGYRPNGALNSGATPTDSPLLSAAFTLWIAVQLLMPIRHLLYPGNVLWTEEGYRFSWRVMLVEKSGWIRYTVTDRATGRKAEVKNSDFLTSFQEKQMAIQPDCIEQFAQFLARFYQENHDFTDPVVSADSHVALNGRASHRFIDPHADLSVRHGNWLAPRPWVLTPAFYEGR